MTEVSGPETAGCRFWSVSFHDCQYIACIHGGALHSQNLLDYAILRRLDFVLHLHGFHDHDTLAGLDFGFFRHYTRTIFPGMGAINLRGPPADAPPSLRDRKERGS